MNRQQIFTNMVTILHGKGQGKQQYGPGGDPVCSYFPEGHPGCAIGCQPGFREKFEDKLRASGDNECDISTVLDSFPDVRDFFGIEFSPRSDSDDYEFLSDLQELHDSANNWTKRKRFRCKSLADFAKEWDLKVPKLPA